MIFWKNFPLPAFLKPPKIFYPLHFDVQSKAGIFEVQSFWISASSFAKNTEFSPLVKSFLFMSVHSSPESQ